MNIELLEILRCPISGQILKLKDPEYKENRIYSGWLVSEDGAQRYPIREYIPRFVDESNYADNFGLQWNTFKKTQLDSYSGHPISSERFWKATGWEYEELKNKYVLDLGCGAGRFAEIALQTQAKVVAVDYSGAVDACYENLSSYPNLDVIQADIYLLPFPDCAFNYIYSLGVLQHTPNVKESFFALSRKLADGGLLCADFYWKRFRTMLHAKYLFRPFTKRIDKKKLFKFLESATPTLLYMSQVIGRVPVIGKILKRLIPVADYTGVYQLTSDQIKDWALLDTFDMLAPEYDAPQTASTIRSWFEQCGFSNIEVFHAGHLVGRGRKST